MPGRPIVAVVITIGAEMKRPKRVKPKVVWDVAFKVTDMTDLSAPGSDLIRVGGYFTVSRSTVNQACVLCALERGWPWPMRLCFEPNWSRKREINESRRRRLAHDHHGPD